jgi:hypothetical protein
MAQATHSQSVIPEPLEVTAWNDARWFAPWKNTGANYSRRV